MDTNETTPEVDTELVVETPKTKLTRKALVIGGAAVGIVIAGGLALLKKLPKADEEFEGFDDEDDSSDEDDSESTEEA